jgi:hypothetical protein
LIKILFGSMHFFLPGFWCLRARLLAGFAANHVGAGQHNV